ncbi:MAG: acetate--CoA ligase family protein, partial [Chloroflexota bacterium]
ALAWLPLPTGRRMAVLTNAGGPGVMAADSLEANGLPLAELSSATLASLRGLLPPAASLNNPIDMLSSASPSQYAACLSALLADEGVDGVLVILPPPPTYSAESVADALIPLIKASPKPVTVALMGSNLVQEAYRRLNAARIPTYDFPERAASALGALARRAEFLTTENTENFKKNFSVDSVVNADELIAAYGIPTAPIKLARSADEAASLAEELGFPVVLKIASADILHKSDVSGVLLNQNTKSEVHTGYTQMMKQVKAARPEAKIEGVYLQKQIPQGQEVILGAARDPQFGPLMMFGSGGVEVEGLKDVAFALAPLNEREAEQMILRTWAGRKLAGFRNIPPADREAVKDALIRLSWLAYEHQEIEEIEINPLRVLGQGAAAVDVRMKLAKRGEAK